MGKFRKGIVEDIKEKQEFSKAQEELKKKHHIAAAEERIVVEKSNTFKFLVRTGAGIVRVTASIAIAGLAMIGLMGIVYPGPRMELQLVAYAILDQVKLLLNL